MQISPISFGYGNKPNNDKETDKYSRDEQMFGDVLSRREIRNHIESSFDATYLYGHEIGAKTLTQLKSEFKHLASANPLSQKHSNSQNKNKVDFSKLKELGSSFAHEKRQNELYSGAKLTAHPEGFKKAKEAGIKTIIALEGIPNDNYQTQAIENGFNYKCLLDIGNNSLGVFSIIPTQTGGKALYNLIAHPENWAVENSDGSRKEDVQDKNVCDIQEFIDILDGKNQELPLPIYYGCAYGTNRTYAWTALYNILRDADRTKPLDDEKIDKLVELADNLEEAYK